MTLPAGPDALPLPALCLIVLDGWGIARDGPGNAISLADTPVFDELVRRSRSGASAASSCPRRAMSRLTTTSPR